MDDIGHARRLLSAALGVPRARHGPEELAFAFRAIEARRAREAILERLRGEHVARGCPPVRAYLVDDGIVVELLGPVTHEGRQALALAAAVVVPLSVPLAHVEPPSRAVDGPVLTAGELDEIGGLS